HARGDGGDAGPGLLQCRPPRHRLDPAAGHLRANPRRRGPPPALPVRAPGGPLPQPGPAAAPAHAAGPPALLPGHRPAGVGRAPAGPEGGWLWLAALLAGRLGPDGGVLAAHG